MFRSDPTEWTDSTLPTTRAGNRVLQHLSGWKAGDPPHPDRDRRPVPPLGYKSFSEVGSTRGRSTAARAVRRFRAAVLPKDRSRSCGRHSKAREPARVLVAIGGKQNPCPHLELKQRWVNQYNF